MATIKLTSTDGKTSVKVQLDNITDTEYEDIQDVFRDLLATKQAYRAISEAFQYAITLCPDANPSDIWQHVIYRTYLAEGKNEQSWKRASGQGFEYAFTAIYNPILSKHGIRLVVLTENTAIKALEEMKLTGKVVHSKIDIAMEGKPDPDVDEWKIFGVIHSKTSLAERIKDDAPASRIIMENGFISLAVTLDSKSFPPPHGDGVNHGELGGRMAHSRLKEDQIKRNYIEKDGDFTNCYSYNLRTPPSPDVTTSGNRIKTMGFSKDQPDEFVNDLVAFWLSRKAEIAISMPKTEVED